MAMEKFFKSTFHNELQSVFGEINRPPIADGCIHRFHINGDRTGSKNGWYILFPSNNAGRFGSWRTGKTYHWSSNTNNNHLDNLVNRQRAEQINQKRVFEQIKAQENAAKRAHQLWINSRCADPQHPYLISKGCSPNSLRQKDKFLLVPIYHEGRLVNLQRISPDGEKRFLYGGRIKGAYHLIGSISAQSPLYICEGWATGATIHEETGVAVACAMNASNLLSAGTHLMNLYLDTTLIIAADDDRQSKGNPGREAATRAAAVLGCGLVLPQWPTDAPPSLSDLNDLRQWLRTQP